MAERIRRSYKHKLKAYSKKNRRKPTPAEKIFRDEVLKQDKTGYRFLRQKPLDNFIMDFYCPSLKLCIEIDGGYHQDEDQIDYDELRENILDSYDIKVVRYINEEVFTNLDSIKDNLDQQLNLRLNELN